MQKIQIERASEVKREEEKIIIGIDLGTTNSLAVWQKNETEQEILCDIVPSIVTILPDGKIIGCEFVEGGITFSSIKRKMGQENTFFEAYGVKLTPEEASSIILKTIKEKAELKLKKEITTCVITVPAYFDDTQRNATKKSAQMAGFEVLRLLNEPTSAAVFYDIENKEEGIYAVFDLGGGTFDISILQMKMGVIKVLAVGGNSQLGGDDFDEILTKHLNVSILEAKKLKEEICTKGSAGGITRDDFDNMIMHLVYNLIDIFTESLRDSKVKKEDIKGIILVGGSTKMPIIKEALEVEFGLPIFQNLDPDRIVAFGGARYAFNTENKTGNLLLDVVPLTLGMETLGGLVLKIIPRNSQIPIRVTEELTTGEDNQTGIIFHIVQGEREFAKDCRSLGTFNITDIPPMPRGIPQIEVCFDVDESGILTVSAIEKVTGKQAFIEVRPTYNLNPRDVRKIFESAMENGKEDMKQRLLEEAKIEARSIIHSAKMYINLKGIEDFMPIVNELEVALTENSEEKIKQLIDQIRLHLKQK